MNDRPRYNRHCPAHDDEPSWESQHWMREDAIICNLCYKRLPQIFRGALFKDDPGGWSMAVDWLTDHPVDTSQPER